MPDAKPLAKAALIELDSELKNPASPAKTTTVQFNPETLKVTFSNSISQKEGQNDQKGTPAMLFVGAGTMKLALQLWFDATAPVPKGAVPGNPETVDNVRVLTQEVSYFITPKLQKDGKTYISPAVRFKWGTFQFDGVMDSLDESLEFFSPDGRPLRASMSLGLSQQKIELVPQVSGPGRPGTPGIRPLAAAVAGMSLQQLAAAQGLGGDWQSIAAANGIENPRLLAAGKLIDVRASVKAGG